MATTQPSNIKRPSTVHCPTEPTRSAGSQLITHLRSTRSAKLSIQSFTRVHVSEQSGDRTGFSGAKRRSFSSRDQLLPRHGSNIESKTRPRRPQQSEPRHLPLQLYGSFLIGYHCMSKRQKHFCDLRSSPRDKKGRNKNSSTELTPELQNPKMNQPLKI